VQHEIEGKAAAVAVVALTHTRERKEMTEKKDPVCTRVDASFLNSFSISFQMSFQKVQSYSTNFRRCSIYRVK
jgi:hypothetical protein